MHGSGDPILLLHDAFNSINTAFNQLIPVLNYRLTGENGKTKLEVDMDSTDEFKDYFLKTWPAALEKVKELAEKN